MESSSIKIQLPLPCSVDWNSMNQQIAGKFCSTCSKVVIDFSDFSDAELLGFFKSNNDKICGRFHYLQLNRALAIPIVPRPAPVINFRKFAVTAFTIISLQGAVAQNSNSVQPITVQRSHLNTDSSLIRQIVISGIVKSNQNEPLQDVIVTTDSAHFVKTDKEGRFELLLKDESHRFNIYFNGSDSFVRAVRSYHPAMQSSFYEVVLDKRNRVFGNYFMGLVEIADTDFPSILFKKNSSVIGYDARALLSVIANKLKDNPTSNIDIMGYPTACGNVPMLIDKRIKAIRIYLSYKLGISADRIFSEKIVEGGDPNVVDFKIHH